MMALTTHTILSPSPPILCFVTIAMVQDHHEDNHGDERLKKKEENKGVWAL